MTRPDSLIREFSENKKGSTAILFGLGFMSALLFVGTAVDYGRAVQMRSKLQKVADAAAIDGVRALKTTGDAQKSWNSMKQQIVYQLTQNGIDANDVNVAEGDTLPNPLPEGKIEVRLKLNEGDAAAVAKIGTGVRTPFLSFTGIDQFNVETGGTASADIKKLDIALMVDMTGSMNDPDNTINISSTDPDCTAQPDGTRMGAMRVAACDMLNVVMPDGDNPNIRVSIVPFSQYVSVDRPTAAKITGQPESLSCRSYRERKSWYGSCSSNYWYYYSSCYRTEYHCGDSRPNQQYVAVGQPTTYYLKTCMKERTGSQEFSDTGPTSGFATTGWTTNPNDTCSTPGHTIMPLTGSKSLIGEKIEGLIGPAGGTAGHMGIAWSWYTIAPDFADTWGVPKRDYEPDDNRNLKAVVIMTDGQFTLHSDAYCDGRNSCTRSNQDARQFCEEMRKSDKKVMVFAVGLGIAEPEDRAGTVNYSSLPDNDPRKVLYDCAGEGRYFFPYDGAELRDAFKQIGKALANTQGTVKLIN